MAQVFRSVVWVRNTVGSQVLRGSSSPTEASRQTYVYQQFLYGGTASCGADQYQDERWNIHSWHWKI
ncbi:hypothetical protein Plhal304r1_c025g0083891 [Plasmopara halstedii]